MILIGIVLFFAILFASHIVVYVKYDGDLTLRLRYLFIVIKLASKDPTFITERQIKKKESDEEKKKNKSEAKLTKKVEAEKKKALKKKKKTKGKKQEKEAKPKKKSVAEIIELVKAVLNLVGEIMPYLKQLVKKIKITNVKVDMKLYSNDAHQTAMQYGQVMAYGNALYCAVDEISQIKIKHINVMPNFYEPSTEIDVSLRIKIRLGRIVLTLLKILIKSLKVLPIIIK